MTGSAWPFEHPPRGAVIPCWSVLKRERPILEIFRDDHEEAPIVFSDGSPFEMAGAALVALEEVAALGPSVLELADLPDGWSAWRSDPESAWERAPQSDFPQ